MLKELQDIGLSEKEARVYMAALELGETTAEKLAKQAQVNRSTTYVQLESLMQKGLISMHEHGKKTHFCPESPEILRRLIIKQKGDLEAKETLLDTLLPGLVQQFEGAGERPVVRFFPGKEGITGVREEILSAKNKELLVIFSSNNMSRLYNEKELDDYTNRRAQVGIRSRAIYTNKQYFDSARGKLSDRRFVKNLPIIIDIRIFDDKVAIFSLEGSPFALVIENKQMAMSVRLIFDFLWGSGERPTK
ncbi:MAG: hypothetical protein JO019_03180 [Candidatus Kaiserbacteria bacterium]|nr:hypothetical protein [Candidatus Kaiserbacteria bacterium]